MINSIFIKTLQERKKAIFFWNIGIFLYVLMIGLVHPYIEGIEEFERILEEMPEFFLAFVGEMNDITTPAGFLGAELYGFMLPLVLSIMAIGMGSSTLSKEEDSGTLELLLASPLPRTTVLFNKAAAVVVDVSLAGISAWLAIAFTTVMIDFDISLSRVAWANASAILTALSFGFIALMITAIGGKKGLAIGISATFFALSYFGNTLAIMIEKIEPLQQYSLLYYYDGPTILREGPTVSYFFLLISVIIVAYAIGALRFRNRNTGV